MRYFVTSMEKITNEYVYTAAGGPIKKANRIKELRCWYKCVHFFMPSVWDISHE